MLNLPAMCRIHVMSRNRQGGGLCFGMNLSAWCGYERGIPTASPITVRIRIEVIRTSQKD